MKPTVFAAFCLVTSIAWAQDGDEAEAEEIDTVELRVSVFENIDVTAEKTPAISADEPDADINAILNEVEALEDDETQE